MGELGRKFRQHMLVCGYAVPAPRPTLRFPEGPRLRLARAAEQATCVVRDSPGARGAAATPPPEDETAPERILRLTGIDVTCCPVCGKGHLVCVRELHRARDGTA